MQGLEHALKVRSKTKEKTITSTKDILSFQETFPN